MFDTVLFFSIAFGLMILHKVVILVSSLDSKSWGDQKLRFLLLTLSLAAIVGGTFGVIFNLAWGGHVLLFGIGGRFAFDRRLIETNRSKLIDNHVKQGVEA